MLTGDAILLADTDRLEPAVADVVPHGSHVQAQSFGNVLDRKHLVGHGFCALGATQKYSIIMYMSMT